METPGSDGAGADLARDLALVARTRATQAPGKDDTRLIRTWVDALTPLSAVWYASQSQVGL